MRNPRHLIALVFYNIRRSDDRNEVLCSANLPLQALPDLTPNVSIVLKGSGGSYLIAREHRRGAGRVDLLAVGAVDVDHLDFLSLLEYLGYWIAQ